MAERTLEQVDALPEIDAGNGALSDPATRALIAQTASQPWWAVNQAWKMVRESARRAVGTDPTRFADTPERVRFLQAEGRVTDDVRRLTETLRGLYDDMKEQPELLTPAAAADFVEAAAKLAQTLDRTSR
jgi:hypothetical protein